MIRSFSALQNEPYVCFLSEQDCKNCLFQAIAHANQVLVPHGFTLFYHQQRPLQFSETDFDPNRPVLLGIHSKNGNELIDIVHMIDFHNGQIKPLFFLTNELISKTFQHVAAKKIDRIFFSAFGSKLDTRLMDPGTVRKDEDDYLRIHGKRLISNLGESENHVFSLDDTISTDILRMVCIDGKIWFFDWHALNYSKGALCVDPKQICTVPKNALSGMHKDRAHFYDGNYLILMMTPMEDTLKGEFFSLLRILNYSY